MARLRFLPRSPLPATKQELKEIRAERRRLVVGFWAMLSFSGSGLLTALGVEVIPSFTLVMPLALVALALCMIPWPRAAFFAPESSFGAQHNNFNDLSSGTIEPSDRI